MGNWGAVKYTSNASPNWFKNLTVGDPNNADFKGRPANNTIYSRPHHPAQNENVVATDRGWEKIIHYTAADGTARYKRELLVANRGLANTLAYGGDETAGRSTGCAGPILVDLRWQQANTAYPDSQIMFPGGEATTIGLIATFSEPVFLNETSGRPYLTLSASTSPDIICYSASGNGTHQVVFSNTTVSLTATETIHSPTDADGNGGGDGIIALNGGVISGTTGGYGRTSNTFAADTVRICNTTSRGIASGTNLVAVGGYAAGKGVARLNIGKLIVAD